MHFLYGQGHILAALLVNAPNSYVTNAQATVIPRCCFKTFVIKAVAMNIFIRIVYNYILGFNRPNGSYKLVRNIHLVLLSVPLCSSIGPKSYFVFVYCFQDKH